MRAKAHNFKMSRKNKIIQVSDKFDACLCSSILLSVSLPLGELSRTTGSVRRVVRKVKKSIARELDQVRLRFVFMISNISA